MAAATGPALWPGASTFPGAAVYPGQDQLPFFRVRVSFDDFSVPTPSWTDVSAKVRSISTSRGRENELSQFDAGTASVVLDDRDRTFDPMLHASVRPMNRIWIYEEFSGEIQDVFRGYVESWKENWPEKGITDATTTISASDEYQVLSANVMPGSGTLDAGQPGALIRQILDLVSNRASRSISPGTGYQIPAQPLTGQAVMDAINSVAISDSGLSVSSKAEGGFFVTKSGALAFVAGTDRDSGPYSSSQLTLGDAGGAERPFLNLATDYSRTFLYNRWTLNGASSSVETASDATSISQFGDRASSRTVLFDVSVDTGMASALVAKYKDAFERVTDVEPMLANADTCLETFRLDLLYQVRLLFQPPGGGARLDQTIYVQKISVTATPGVPPAIALGVSPL